MARETRAAVQARIDASASAQAASRELALLEASQTNQDGSQFVGYNTEGIADSLHAGGKVTAPTLGQAIATLAAPPAGTYEVQVNAWVSASAAADASNVELRRAGSALYTPLIVATQSSPRTYRITLNGAQNLTVNAIAAGTASVVYTAEIVATRVE